MTQDRSDAPMPRKPLRLWPGVTIAVLLFGLRFVAPAVAPAALFVGIMGGFAGALLIVLWWLFFSRAAWSERLGALALAVVAMAATFRFLDVSVARGNMGFQYILHGIPILSLAFVAWAAISRARSDRFRRLTMVATIVLACAAWTLVRSDGLMGDGMAQFRWRWTETPEQRLLAAAGDEQAAMAIPAAELAAVQPTPRTPTPGSVEAPTLAAALPVQEELPGDGKSAGADDAPEAVRSVPALGEIATDIAMEVGTEAVAPVAAEPRPAWPGLRGPDRDGVVRGLRIDTDWSRTPPRELWRRPIGPGVSSFAVSGDLLYTQEQRGEDEIVSAYSVKSGEAVWMHRDAARFWDAHVGAGPRATPAVGDGRVYSLGATGILNALAADDGAVVWSRNAASDNGEKDPAWGFVSSPLVVGNRLVVQAGSLVAYDLATGDPSWYGPPEHGAYSSPQLVTLDGVPQILLVGHASTISVAPADGVLLWEHPWPGIGIVQPAQLPEGDILVSLVDGGAMPIGTRRLAVANGAAGWSVEERWTSNRLKPSFSDVVVHQDYAYGFDGSFLACIDLETGERQWKGGRYGQGQVLLLPDQDLLLVLSEQGELALVEASPDRFNELARIPALEGKTWNQPALVDDVLLVRNGQEMAAFRLRLEPE